MWSSSLISDGQQWLSRRLSRVRRTQSGERVASAEAQALPPRRRTGRVRSWKVHPIVPLEAQKPPSVLCWQLPLTTESLPELAAAWTVPATDMLPEPCAGTVLACDTLPESFGALGAVTVPTTGMRSECPSVQTADALPEVFIAGTFPTIDTLPEYSKAWTADALPEFMSVGTVATSDSLPEHPGVWTADALLEVASSGTAPSTDTLPEYPRVRTADTLPEVQAQDRGGDSKSECKSCTEAGHESLPKALLEAAIQEVSQVLPWVPGQFETVETLQKSALCHGRVDLMRNVWEGGFAVVKRLPSSFSKSGAAEFESANPDAPERPWFDLGLTRYLNGLGFPYACEALGAYQDEVHTYFATVCATGGDLFAWSQQAPCPGPRREAAMQPIAEQVLTAVRWLHDLGISHRDISLENVVLDPREGERMQVKLIDFGMATLSRRCYKGKLFGNPSYCAPEMYLAKEYDAFLSDAFAVGVLIYCLAASIYPWASTRPGDCSFFTVYCTLGFRRLLQQQKLQECRGLCLAEIFSDPLIVSLQGLLAPLPNNRLTLGERAWDAGRPRPSILSMQWPWPREAPRQRT
mmetsp:Transcript_64256/g.199342  ORF Transcript_64256/g.199342 Transcript_64256/m.199342 type:complete len:579 (-) Transcript_64256:514-2250(-)